MNDWTKKGFTLIELIVVLAVLAVLAAILAPGITGFIQNTRKAADQSNIRTLNVATAAFRAQAPAPDPFADPALDEAQLMQVLIDHQYLNDAIVPQVPGTTFSWNPEQSIWLVSDAGLPEQVSAMTVFRNALQGSLLQYDTFLAKGTAWNPQQNNWTEYNPASWNGYLEKLLERGDVTDNTRYKAYEGTNTIGYENPVSQQQTVVDFNNWDTIKRNYPEKVPPAILITNQSHFNPDSTSSYIQDNLDSLVGAMVIYKNSSSTTPNSETVVYMIQSDGSLSDPVPLMDVLP